MNNETKIKKTLDWAGRIVIPMPVRRDMGLSLGDSLEIKVVVIEGKKYILIAKEGE